MKFGNGEKLFFSVPWKIYCFTGRSCCQRIFSPPKVQSQKDAVALLIGLINISPHFSATEEAQVKLELALRNSNQQTHTSSTDSSEGMILHCPTCNFQTSGSLEAHQNHHEKNYGLQCPFCSYSVGKEEELNFHLIYHHSRVNHFSEDEVIQFFVLFTLLILKFDYYTV